MKAERLVRGRFTALLLALVTLMLTTPLVEEVAGVRWAVLDTLFTALILALLYVMSRERHFLLLAVFLALPAVGTRWGVRATANDVFAIASFVIQIAFLGVSMVVVLLEILRSQRVTTDTIFGGISVYMLIALTFALIFGLIDFLDPEAFSFGVVRESNVARLPGRDGFAELLYFSFVTLTTLGYGDFVPQSGIARNVSALEAVIGQIYLAVFVARLVGLHMADNRSGSFET